MRHAHHEGHLHVRIVPREENDGLPLPWTLTACRPCRYDAERSHFVNSVNLVMARESIPAGPSVFLAGPTPDKAPPSRPGGPRPPTPWPLSGPASSR
ncbi:hypothetical protein [Streptomyces goshikiensis]|uniref:hypothetical protein n=1 Tax=Streptomyces goshikiensis TaxID=1942 RepID=UPI003722CF68